MLLIQTQLKRFFVLSIGIFILCNMVACSADTLPCSHKNSLKPCEQENDSVELVILQEIGNQIFA
ncbi:MAG: hypothetical protein ACPG49_14670 [Chitinophagales bacterium]